MKMLTDKMIAHDYTDDMVAKVNHWVTVDCDLDADEAQGLAEELCAVIRYERKRNRSLEDTITHLTARLNALEAEIERLNKQALSSKA
jgi:hypothetical protein